MTLKERSLEEMILKKKKSSPIIGNSPFNTIYVRWKIFIIIAIRKEHLGGHSLNHFSASSYL